jgi:acyl-coenzyme A thioesterase PaaI-like protein
MPQPAPPLGEQLLHQWQRIAGLPFGKRFFSWMVGRKAPYTQTVGGVFVDLRPGFASVELRDRRAIRNHLSSIHAVALVNVAEMTSGVALMTALPAGVRGIVTSLSIEYLKKARGRLICTTATHAPDRVVAPIPFDVVADITDSAGDLVARATVQWTLSPTPAKTLQPTA